MPKINHLAASGVTKIPADADDASGRSRSDLPQELALHILDEAADGVLVTDYQRRDNPIIYTNPAFTQISSYHPAEVLGRNCRFLQREDTDQPEIALMREAIAAERPVAVTLRNYRRDGSMFWNEVRLAPIRSGNCPRSEVTHYVGFQRDVTARISSEAELRQALQEAEEAHAAKLRFLAVMGHEFRTPIGIILGFADLLMAATQRGETELRQREYLADMRGAARHLLSVVEDARHYVQIATQTELTKQPTRLREVIEGMAAQVGPMLHDAGIILRVAGATDSPMVQVDLAMLRQSLIGLVGELARRAPRGAKIKVRSHSIGPNALISIQCTSLVLSQEAVERLRNPFASKVHMRGLEGAGVAVTVTERVLQLHDGKLWIESTASAGTFLHLSLPLASYPLA